ncbi:hypothetical protein HUG17_4413 [Dermatophagoides farinae]|uniref:Uncharacterized protein n=1 Tax=Dermatophagoides farinae TaxID=6954 RepID=A0A9D4NYY1_DERFA|nr:hypothetical protein HUG17_4413 [Dermatophagoides farinae]
MISLHEIKHRIIRLILRCLIIPVPDEQIPINYLTGKYFQSLFKYDHNRLADQSVGIQWPTINDKRIQFAFVFLIFFIIRSFILANFIDNDDNLYLTIFGSGFRLLKGNTFSMEMTTCLLSITALTQWIVMFISTEANFFFKLNIIYVKQIYSLLDSQLNKRKRQKLIKRIAYQPDISLRLFIQFFCLIRISCTFGIPFGTGFTSMAIFIISDPKMNNIHVFYHSNLLYYGYSLFISFMWTIWAFIIVDLLVSIITLFPIILLILRYKSARLIEYVDYRIVRIKQNYDAKTKQRNQQQQINICIRQYVQSINLLIDEIFCQIHYWRLHLTTLYQSCTIIIGFFLYVLTSVKNEWIFRLCFIELIILSITMLFLYTKIAAKYVLQSKQIRIHDTQAIIPKYPINLRNHLKIQNHVTLIDTDSLIFTQCDGIKLGPIIQITIIAQIMAMYLLIMQLFIGKFQS